MDKKLTKHLQHLQAFNNQRRAWLILSFFVILETTKIIYDWSAFEAHHLLWSVVTIGLTISIVWWYWTMKMIRQLIEHRKEESEILYEIVDTIRDIKEDVKNLPVGVDKDK